MPVDKLRKFILAIDDIEERKEVAYRWKDHQSALEVSTLFNHSLAPPQIYSSNNDSVLSKDSRSSRTCSTYT